MRNPLVTAPPVSKTWQAPTPTPAPQRALLLQADPLSECIQNPLLVELFPHFFATEQPSCWSWPDAEAIQSMPWSKAPKAFKRPKASWRRMLFVQPLAPMMVVSERCHLRGGNFDHRAVLDDPCLHMGVLYNLVLPFIDRVASGLSIHWPSEDSAAEPSLRVIYTKQCCPCWEWEIHPQFYSHANKTARSNLETNPGSTSPDFNQTLTRDSVVARHSFRKTPQSTYKSLAFHSLGSGCGTNLRPQCRVVCQLDGVLDPNNPNFFAKCHG
ncbi:hypothetical protein DFH08DRAFT_813170 [Mycena albidolilacea]|uniref:Uncharacterized protein n=1 Tax=Mycena albidolilacea TaxID=1033008 RepID=A0AAD6ZS78_9AGAR|nr:hypothetical protein DFH08DRAFT_813170 [Mycena albidolilacea]